MSILEDLYFGNIDPNTGGHCQKAAETASATEDRLMALLTCKERDLFIDYANANAEINGATAVEKFTLGFRLGALFLVDVFTGTK